MGGVELSVVLSHYLNLIFYIYEIHIHVKRRNHEREIIHSKSHTKNQPGAAGDRTQVSDTETQKRSAFKHFNLRLK